MAPFISASAQQMLQPNVLARDARAEGPAIPPLLTSTCVFFVQEQAMSSGAV